MLCWTLMFLVSASIVQGTQFELLRLGKIGKIKLFTSPAILKEVVEVLHRPKFGFSPEQITNALEEIQSIVHIVYPRNKPIVVKEDPDDDEVIACALEASADYIISGDSHLLELKRYGRITILDASGFLRVFDV